MKYIFLAFLLEKCIFCLIQKPQKTKTESHLKTRRHTRSSATKQLNKTFGGFDSISCFIIAAKNKQTKKPRELKHTLTYWISPDVQSKFDVHSGFILTFAHDWESEKKKNENKQRQQKTR